MSITGIDDAKRRFSSRVADYLRYRPAYPSAVVDWLRGAAAFAAGSHVVDLGSGTGLLARVFLDAGARVTGVEPNASMRRAGARELADYPRWRCIDGSAEATGLAGSCADLVVSGQAFHWFDPDAARDECLRILRGAPRAAMIWNERHLEGAFMHEYEQLLLEFAPDYEKITASHVDETMLGRFFGGRSWRRHETPNTQVLDYAGLEGRLMSSSYAPPRGSRDGDVITARLERLFDRHACDGAVVFPYRTIVIFGAL
ncbi:MAG: class I SAM-dependent methyltransferase [Proteobacteria bacterium]|nr:MAG: class I SAM-dependent methyltransferase [Pseudomonadota bacterium]